MVTGPDGIGRGVRGREVEGGGVRERGGEGEGEGEGRGGSERVREMVRGRS